jgi:L-amino acid N-acyltransferase YncA
MAGEFTWTKFGSCNLEDPFFDSFKKEYAEFSIWFKKKTDAGEEALVARDDQGILAFVYLKAETEPIKLQDRELPAVSRLKIGTFKMADRFQGQRVGEGAMGVALWRWQELRLEEVYATIFDEHGPLMALFERFGFRNVGLNARGECVYLRSRKHIDYSDPYTSFPFINPDIKKAGIIPIEAEYHDRLFQFSELKGTEREIEQEAAGNGMTKVYIATPYKQLSYKTGEPVFIYRKTEHQGNGQSYYRSCVTSFTTVTKVHVIKENGKAAVSCDDFVREAGNKTIFAEDVLRTAYLTKANIVLLEMVYNGVFGKGHNVTFGELHGVGLFEEYPYGIEYSKEEFIKILEMGGRDAKNIIVDQT